MILAPTDCPFPVERENVGGSMHVRGYSSPLNRSVGVSGIGDLSQRSGDGDFSRCLSRCRFATQHLEQSSLKAKPVPAMTKRRIAQWPSQRMT